MSLFQLYSFCKTGYLVLDTFDNNFEIDQNSTKYLKDRCRLSRRESINIHWSVPG